MENALNHDNKTNNGRTLMAIINRIIEHLMKYKSELNWERN